MRQYKKFSVFLISLFLICGTVSAEALPTGRRAISEDELMNVVSQAGQYLTAARYKKVISLLEPKLPAELEGTESTAYIGFYAVGYYNLGISYLMTYKLEEAVKALSKSRDTLPEWSGPYYLLGQAYFGLGDANKSIENFEKGIELEPKAISPEDYISLISDYVAIGSREKAKTLMGEAKEMFPEEFKDKAIAT